MGWGCGYHVPPHLVSRLSEPFVLHFSLPMKTCRDYVHDYHPVFFAAVAGLCVMDGAIGVALFAVFIAIYCQRAVVYECRHGG